MGGHQIVQGDSSTEGAWAHVWLYRIEGDLVNARYWYRRPQVICARKGRRLQRFFWGADPSNLTSWVLPPH
jgi:hypothetical protein